MPKQRKLTIDQDERVYALLERAAGEGRRCPTNPDIGAYLRGMGMSVADGTIASVVTRLARQGRIVVRIYPRNYRVIEICHGPHRGKNTMGPRIAGKVRLVIDASRGL